MLEYCLPHTLTLDFSLEINKNNALPTQQSSSHESNECAASLFPHTNLSVDISCLVHFRTNPRPPSRSRRTVRRGAWYVRDGLQGGDSSRGNSSTDLLRNERCPAELLGIQPPLCCRASLMGHDRLSRPPMWIEASLCSQTRWSSIRPQHSSLWNHVAQLPLLPPSSYGPGGSQTRAVNQRAEPFRHVQWIHKPQQWHTRKPEAPPPVGERDHSSHLLRNSASSERRAIGQISWAKVESYITLYALIQSFMTPLCTGEMLSFMFFSTSKTQSSSKPAAVRDEAFFSAGFREVRPINNWTYPPSNCWVWGSLLCWLELCRMENRVKDIIGAWRIELRLMNALNGGSFPKIISLHETRERIYSPICLRECLYFIALV